MPTEFHLVYFITVLSEAEEFRAHVSCVPNSNTFVSTACDHQVLVKWRVIDTHDGGNVRINALRRISLSHIPDLQFLVITDRCELVLIVMVPADILDDLGVGQVNFKHGVDRI